MESQVISERNGHGNATFENEALLSDRYKLIKPLGAGGMGQTYIAEDTQRPGNPKCVVKQLKPIRSDAEFLETARRLFASEAEMLEKLGIHDQIPRLLAYFEQNQEFYLVQELVDGQPLSAEMPLGEQWSESQVIQLLHEAFSVLAFVQSHTVIHRDIKPDNIMRRHSDSKLVLIDFGAVKQVRMQQLTNLGQTGFTVVVGTPGYMPSEQSMGKPHLSSDIYALGMVAVQALTGLLPTQMREDANGELDWRRFAPEVSDDLAAMLARMVRRFHKQRYQSAMEALQALEELRSTESEPSPVSQPKTENQECAQTDVNPSVGRAPGTESTNQKSTPQEPPEPAETVFNPDAMPKPQPEVQKPTRTSAHWTWKRYSQLGAGVTAVALCMGAGFGYTKTREQANQQQQQAYEEMQQLKSDGKLGECIGKAEDFVKTPHSYFGMNFDNPETHSDVKSLADNCRHTREERQHALENLKQLQANGKFEDAIVQAKTFIQVKSELTPDAQKILGECQLASAQQLAKSGNYVNAIAIVTEIAPDASVFKEAQRQIGDWSEKILEVATDLYQNGKSGDFPKALQIAGAVPKDSPIYNKAQTAIKQWQKDEAQDQQNFESAKAALNKKQWDDSLGFVDKLTKSPATAWRSAGDKLRDEATTEKQKELEPLNVSDGVLSDGSPKLSSDNSPYQEYPLDKIDGKTVTITMESAEFSPYLIVRTPDGKEFNTRDQDGRTVALTISSSTAGTYKILANAHDPQGRGRYTLKAHIVN